MRQHFVNGSQKATVNDTACHPKPNGRRPAEEDSTTPTMPGATNLRKRSHISTATGIRHAVSANHLKTATVCSTWATTFTNGVWIGTGIATIWSRPRRIRKAPRKAAAAYRVAAPGVIRLRHHALPTEAVCRRSTGTRTMASESFG